MRLAVFLVLVASLFAVEPPKGVSVTPLASFPALTSQEQIEILAIESEALKAEAALRASVPFATFSAVQAKLNARIDQVYASRNITKEQAVLCDKQADGPCKDAASVGLTLIAQPKPATQPPATPKESK